MNIALLAAATLLASPQVGGRRIVPPHRLEKLQAGVNISRWFRQPTSYSEDHFRNYISDDEMDYMSQMGLKHARLLVDLNLLMLPDGRLAPKMANLVEDAIHRLNGHGLAVVLAISNDKRKETEGNIEFMRKFDAFWKRAATRFAVNDPDMLYFELLSEPHYVGHEHDWIRYQDLLVKDVRAAAPQYTLIVTGPTGGGLAGFHKMHKLDDGNIVYSFHFYEPFRLASQATMQAARAPAQTRRGRAVGRYNPDAYITGKRGRPAYTAPPAPPSKIVPPYGDPRWGRYELWSRVDYPIWWGAENQVPVYCGAFGVTKKSTPNDQRLRWYEDLNEAFRANKTCWAVWNWDDGYGLNRELVNGHLTVDPSSAGGLGLKPELYLEESK
jgi:aryl-phospho-beta-D-glucosidase BglC (GH1 family)